MRIFAIASIVLALSGCCTPCRDRYEPALKQWQENLEALRPTFVKGVKAEGLPDPKLEKAKIDRYDRTIQGIERVRGEGGPEVWSEEGAGE